MKNDIEDVRKFVEDYEYYSNLVDRNEEDEREFKKLNKTLSEYRDKIKIDGNSLEDFEDMLGSEQGQTVAQYLKDDSLYTSKAFLTRAKQLADDINSGKTDFKEHDLIGLFSDVAKKVKSEYADLKSSDKNKTQANIETAAIGLAAKASDPRHNPFISPKAIGIESESKSSEKSNPKPKGVRKNFQERIEKAIVKGDTLSFRYTKKDGTVEKLAIKPYATFPAKNGQIAVKGYKDGIEDKEHIRMVYVDSMGGDKPFVPRSNRGSNDPTNLSLPRSRANQIDKMNPQQLIREVAGSNDATCSELAYVKNNPDESVRAAVASNPNSTPGTLLSLSSDKSVAVRKGLAKNSNTQGYVLGRIAKETHEAWEELAKNKSTPLDTLNFIANGARRLYQNNEVEQSAKANLLNRTPMVNFEKGAHNVMNNKKIVNFLDNSLDGAAELKRYKESGNGNGKSPQELKKDFLKHMSMDNYDSADAWSKAMDRIKKMSPSDFQKMFAAIVSDEE